MPATRQYDEIAYYDGQWGKPSEMRIPLEDRGYIFGEGVYEAFNAFNHVIWGLEEHLDRLEFSLQFMDMPLPCPRAELTALLQQAVDMVKSNQQMLYMQLTRGYSPRRHAYPDVERSTLTIISRDHTESPSYVDSGGAAITVADKRWQHCNIKTLNLIPSAMAAKQAERAGVFASIFHRDGVVTEAQAHNAFMVSGVVVYTAPLSELILPGITRKHILQICEQLGIPYKEEYFTVEQMYNADEVFISSTTKYPLPIHAVDGHTIGDGATGPITRRIHAAYLANIEALCGKIS
ncbi:MAG: aminotransferase class IV [Bacillota bacterium]|nr:aminotransferase class IV [Bacillota bacterium]